jgi:hypothetical protein
MGQWGEQRLFTDARAAVRLTPHIETAAFFAPASPHDQIDLLVLIDAAGKPPDILRLLGKINERFVGKPYVAWCDHV